MGVVKDTVKGTPPPAPPAPKKVKVTDKNLIIQFGELQDKISELTQIKDDDVLTEGPTEKPENVRKAALLRGVHSLVTSAKTLLEDY